jgi:hypothetical protein
MNIAAAAAVVVVVVVTWQDMKMKIIVRSLNRHAL